MPKQSKVKPVEYQNPAIESTEEPEVAEETTKQEQEEAPVAIGASAPPEVTADSAESADATENAGSETEASSVVQGEWKVGEKAHQTLYEDLYTGNLVTEQPERSNQLVQEGDVITTSILNRIELERGK